MDRPSSWWSSLLSAHSCKARWPCEAFFLTFFGLEAAGSGRPRRPINPAFPRNNRFGLAGFSLIRRLNSGYEMSHFRLEFDIVQRSRGGSALHMSAYQARGQFAAPGGQIKDYSSRGDHIATLMFAPAGAPDWINDPQEARLVRAGRHTLHGRQRRRRKSAPAFSHRYARPRRRPIRRHQGSAFQQAVPCTGSRPSLGVRGISECLLQKTARALSSRLALERRPWAAALRTEHAALEFRRLRQDGQENETAGATRSRARVARNDQDARNRM